MECKQCGLRIRPRDRHPQRTGGVEVMLLYLAFHLNVIEIGFLHVLLAPVLHKAVSDGFILPL